MVSDAPEQIATPLADQDALQGQEQVIPAADAAAAPVPAPVTSEPAHASQPFDLTTDAGIKAAIEANPQLRGFFDKTRSDTENTVRQRLESQMRRDQGASERARQYQQQLAQKYGIELDPEDVAQGPLWVKANEEYAVSAVLTSMAEQAIEFATPDQQALLRTMLEQADTPDKVKDVTATVLSTIRGQDQRRLIDELSPEQLAEHPKFKDWIAAYKTQEVEAEMNARETERTRLEAPPVTPTGQGTSGMSKSQLDAMTPAARLAYLATLSDAERAGMWDLAMSV